MGGIHVSDYAMIKNGSYGKLMKAYYAMPRFMKRRNSGKRTRKPERKPNKEMIYTNVMIFNTASKTGNSIFAGNLPMMQKSGLKSTQEKVERQQKAQSQIAFWESQKESLKNIECDTLEDIAKKLDKFHSYESEIAAVKMQYNQEQMWHAMDEAKEIGERIAEEAKKFEPKTAEERREDMVEEALGADESKGALTESMEKMQEEMAELSEDMSQTIEEAAESVEETFVNMAEESVEAMEDAAGAEVPVSSAAPLLDQAVKYKRLDVLI